MVAYRVEVARSAERQLEKISRSDQQRVVRTMLALAEEPRPRGSRKLASYQDLYRVRVGRYRIIYRVTDADITVLILKVASRQDVYQLP